MKKIMILDTALKEIESLKTEETKKEPIVLHGIAQEGVSIIASTDMKKGLKRIGLVCMEDNTPPDDENIFKFEDGELRALSVSEDGEREEAPVEVINYTTDFAKRLKGVVDNTVLRNRSVVVLGAGSGGGTTALDFIKSGLEKLTLIDPDIVSISNICRSVYDLTDIGKKKVDALHEKLLRINPNADIKVYDEDILEMDHTTLMEIIDGADLIVEATDNVKTKKLINGLAHNTTPVIYPSVYEGGKGGDILITLPGLPCFECVFKSTFSSAQTGEKREWDYTTGKPRPMPGLLPDIQVIVARSVKLALAILTGEGEASLLEKVTEPGCTMLLIGNEKGFSIFDRPFQEVWAETEINPECFCQTLQ